MKRRTGMERSIKTEFILFIVLVLHFYFPVCSFAGAAGTTSAQFLKNEISPRAAGMAGSFVSVADDIYSVYYNPAGIGQLYMPEISALYYDGFSDIKTNFIAFGMPLPFIGLAGYGNSAVAFSYLRQSDGNFTYRYIDPVTGNISETKTNAETNSLLTVSYAEKIFSGVVDLEGYNADIMQFLGFSAKYLKSTLLDKYSASAFTFDAGYLVTEMNLAVSFGASLSNGGGRLKYYSAREPLPLIARAGFSHFRHIIGDQTIMFSVASDFYPNEKINILKLGLEYHFEGIFNLRLGYKTGDNSGFTGGLGFEHRGFLLDFGFALGNEVYNESQIALSYKFYGFKGYKPARKKPFKEYKEPQKPAKKKKAPVRKKPPTREKDDFLWIY